MKPNLPTLSIIIPIWNDAAQLAAVLAAIARIPEVHEVIVADASDGPECRAVAQAAGATIVSCPEPSRGKQMNAAAAVATGDVLLFQHADTEISAAHAHALRSATIDATVVCGAFHRRV